MKGKVSHAAVSMGCLSCHTGIDAKKVPHKKTGAAARGLSMDAPDLCYGCHDKALFIKKNVHAALGMGCTGCHNPHSSDTPKLLQSELPDLCFGCHDKKIFTQKTIHAPVAGGMCLSCHLPHSSESETLLVDEPAKVCLSCHEELTKKLHATASGHPMGLKKKHKKSKRSETAEVIGVRPGPAREDIDCGSCHDPHSSNSPRMFRFNAQSAMSLCVNCHKM